jgi:uncharacterized metal-binding protein YceD (DUF177 family)
MSEPTPEFSRLVPLARLGPEPFRPQIEATEEECECLARRFDLVTLDRLTAVVTLHRQTDGLIRLEAVFEAEFAQVCVVTLDPVPAKIAHPFALLYGPAADAQAEIELDADEPVFEPLTGDAIDIGEAVAQELSLSLPDFPRLPDAAVEPIEADEPDGGAFAELMKLRRSP